MSAINDDINKSAHGWEYSCDACNKSIDGVSHRCLDCREFDLCSACVRDPANRHPGHRFVPLYSDEHDESRRAPRIPTSLHANSRHKSENSEFYEYFKTPTLRDTKSRPEITAALDGLHSSTLPAAKAMAVEVEKWYESFKYDLSQGDAKAFVKAVSRSRWSGKAAFPKCSSHQFLIAEARERHECPGFGEFCLVSFVYGVPVLARTHWLAYFKQEYKIPDWIPTQVVEIARLHGDIIAYRARQSGSARRVQRPRRRMKAVARYQARSDARAVSMSLAPVREPARLDSTLPVVSEDAQEPRQSMEDPDMVRLMGRLTKGNKTNTTTASSSQHLFSDLESFLEEREAEKGVREDGLDLPTDAHIRALEDEVSKLSTENKNLKREMRGVQDQMDERFKSLEEDVHQNMQTLGEMFKRALSKK